MTEQFRQRYGIFNLPVMLMALAIAQLMMGQPIDAQKQGDPTGSPTPEATEQVIGSGAASIVGTVYQTTNIRSGPGTRFDIVGQLSEGDQVEVLGRDTSGAWLQISTLPALTGWLPAFALVLDVEIGTLELLEDEPDTPPEGSDVTVESYGQVNVRSGPGIDYAIVGQLDVGDQVEAVARSNRANDWLMVVLDEDREGWVAYFTIRVSGDTSDLPVLTPDATGQVLVEPNSLAQTRFNVRLHEDPELSASVIAVIPFGRTVTPLGKTPDGDWMLVAYQEVTGWGSARLFSIADSAFDDLPVQPESGSRP